MLEGTPLESLFYNSSADKKKAAEGAEAGLKYFQSINDPTYKNINYQGPESAGDVAYQGVGPTAYNNITVDPQLREAQQAQLSALSGLAKNGGMNAADIANLNQIQNQTNQNAAAQRQAVLQQAQMRGAATGGNALMAQLMANQNAANQNNQSGLEVAGMAQNRALQAGQAAGQLGSQMEGQQYAQQAQRAAAQDAIAQFNARNALQNAQYNNQQQQERLNTSNKYQNENQYINNIQLPTQQFQNKMAIGNGISNAGMNQANFYGQQMANQQKQQGAIIGGAAQLGALAASGGTSGIVSGLASKAMQSAHGGKVPGISKHHGDSLDNDTVHVLASPGEVIVPRTLANHGTDLQISEFVKHPPSSAMPDKNRAAMLSALKHIRSRGGL